jgi:hypothetical protein
VSEFTRVRLKRWGKDHLVEKKAPKTFCGLFLPWKTLELRGDRLCVQCRREAERRVSSKKKSSDTP